MKRYWIAVASREHVLRGVDGGFAQVCHGKPGPLRRMKAGDWIIYYSPTEKFGQPGPCRRFTAIGSINPLDPYKFCMGPDFTPWRRNVSFLEIEEVAIEPLIDKLSFIQNKRFWGFIFRRGCFEISLSDFNLIASWMGVSIREKNR